MTNVFFPNSAKSEKNGTKITPKKQEISPGFLNQSGFINLAGFLNQLKVSLRSSFLQKKRVKGKACSDGHPILIWIIQKFLDHSKSLDLASMSCLKNYPETKLKTTSNFLERYRAIKLKIGTYTNWST